jgi:hypothetical protein
VKIRWIDKSHDLIEKNILPQMFFHLKFIEAITFEGGDIMKMMGKKKEQKEIEEIVEEKGYILLDHYIGEDHKTKVIIKDNWGYKYGADLYNLTKSPPCFVHSSNLFSLHNIALWLQLNKKTFELTSNNIYKGNDFSLEFYCHECTEIFYAFWGQIFYGSGCSVCCGRQAGKYHSLQFLRPDLMNEWSSKNILDPSKLTIKSEKRVLWVCCKCGHEWDTRVYSRTNGGGCPACCGFVVTDKNRLSKLYPYLSEEWDYENNSNLLPSEVSYGSNKKINWVCPECGNHWKDSIVARTTGRGCPQCNMSGGESRINAWLKTNCINFIYQYGFEDCRSIIHNRMLRFDFCILDEKESTKILIEFDDLQHDKFIPFFHKTMERFLEHQQRDKTKTDYCLKNNYKLIRIKQKNFNEIEEILSRELQDCRKEDSLI